MTLYLIVCGPIVNSWGIEVSEVTFPSIVILTVNLSMVTPGSLNCNVKAINWVNNIVWYSGYSVVFCCVVWYGVV